jgi:hypothetical protein
LSDRRRSSKADAARQERVAAYKTVLRQCIDRRPSGVRQRIARALGTHRSFVSQITNPSDPTAVPARHVPTILDLAHATAEERGHFAKAYEAAHPGALASVESRDGGARRTLTVEIPALADPAAQAALEDLIRSTAQRLAAIARMQTPDTDQDEEGETTP